MVTSTGSLPNSLFNIDKNMENRLNKNHFLFKFNNEQPIKEKVPKKV